MTTPQHRFLIIADGEFGPLTSKTANSCIRYFPERIVAVLDRKQAGKTVQDVLGFGGTIPIVGDFERGIAQEDLVEVAAADAADHVGKSHRPPCIREYRR